MVSFINFSKDSHWPSTDLPWASAENWSANVFALPLMVSQFTLFHRWTSCGADLEISALRLKVCYNGHMFTVDIPGAVSTDEIEDTFLVNTRSKRELSLVDSFCICQRPFSAVTLMNLSLMLTILQPCFTRVFSQSTSGQLKSYWLRACSVRSSNEPMSRVYSHILNCTTIGKETLCVIQQVASWFAGFRSPNDRSHGNCHYLPMDQNTLNFIQVNSFENAPTKLRSFCLGLNMFSLIKHHSKWKRENESLRESMIIGKNAITPSCRGLITSCYLFSVTIIWLSLFTFIAPPPFRKSPYHCNLVTIFFYFINISQSTKRAQDMDWG